MTDQENLIPEDFIEENSADETPSLSSLLEKLLADFQSKLKYDEHKNKIIDEQHAELQEFRGGLLRKIVTRILADVIFELDDTEKLTRFYEAAEPTPENYEKLLKLTRQFAENLRLLLEKNEAVPYRCEPGTPFDPRRQRAMSILPTDDPAKDKTVAATIRWGFEYEGKVLRQEMVEVYRYE